MRALNTHVWVETSQISKGYFENMWTRCIFNIRQDVFIF